MNTLESWTVLILSFLGIRLTLIIMFLIYLFQITKVKRLLSLGVCVCQPKLANHSRVHWNSHYQTGQFYMNIHSLFVDSRRIQWICHCHQFILTNFGKVIYEYV